jgi:hypothetical protein
MQYKKKSLSFSKSAVLIVNFGSDFGKVSISSLALAPDPLQQFNRDHLPNRVLRNADNLRIPAHHFASIKRLPVFSFPQLWNEESARKFNPSLETYSTLNK